MISVFQTRSLAQKYQTNDATIFREYLQLLFLSRLYAKPGGKSVIFKGGTAIHLIFGAPRFSEDLDFAVMSNTSVFEKDINGLFTSLSKLEDINFKSRQTIAGRRYLLSAALPGSRTQSFINLDFSFREPVVEPEMAILETEYPVIFTSQVYHMSKSEIVAEKIRAIMNRRKGRDVYDLWYLLSQRASLNLDMISKKLAYYDQTFSDKALVERIKSFSKEEFALDLRPFVAVPERNKLEDFYTYTQNYLVQKFSHFTGPNVKGD